MIFAIVIVVLLSFFDPTASFSTSKLPWKPHIQWHRHSSLLHSTKFLNKGDTLAVFGASGGVGQLICGKLVAAGYNVIACSRDPSKTKAAFGDLNKGDTLSYAKIDLISANERGISDVISGVQGIVICTGTTAFPTSKWRGGNTPTNIDLEATKKILSAIHRINRELDESDEGRVKKVMLLTSIGTKRRDKFPFVILNLFKVLDCKRGAEEALVEASENDSYTHVIVRPGRLIGGPWTNYDLAGLFQMQSSGGGVKMEIGDELVGDASRDRIAQVCFAALSSPVCSNVEFAVIDDDEETLMSEDEMGAVFGEMVGLEV